MLSTKEVQSLLNGSTSYRGDCPICGGRNSFSASITQGDVAWICFKASCSERGRDYSTRSVEQIVTALLRSSLSIPTNDFIIPDYFTGIEHKDNAIKFFKRLHILPLYNEGRLKLRYDPKQDRAVFLIERGGKVVDAMGRSLSNSLNSSLDKCCLQIKLKSIISVSQFNSNATPFKAPIAALCVRSCFGRLTNRNFFINFIY